MATLYGAKGGSSTTSDLYEIDPATAVATPIGAIGFAVTGLAFDPTTGILYGVTSNNSAVDPRCLITIDPLTGAGTLVGSLGMANPLTDIAFDSLGNLFAWPARGADSFASIDKATGAATPIGAAKTFTSGGGLSFDSADVLWHIPFTTGRDITTITLATGAEANVSVLGAGPGANGPNAAAFDSLDVCYALWNISPTVHLVTIDEATGVVTDIGATTNLMDGLAWEFVPPTPPPAQTVLRFGEPPLWRLIVTTIATATLTVLDKRATDRGFVFAVGQPATTTGLVPSDDPEINIPAPDPDSPAFLSNNSRLIYGLRREVRASPGDDPWVCRFAGIVMQLEDIGADTPTSRYTACDPWQYLMSRPIRQNDGTLAPSAGITYTDASASDMALDLLANTIAVDGPVFIDASDPYLIETTDVINGKTVFDRGISVGEAWQQLCATGTIDIILRPVYDPINRPGILCELVIAKQAGEIRYDAVMGWDRASRSITDISRLIDGTRLADRVLFYAGQGGNPVTLQSDAAAIADYGEYWAQVFMVGKDSQRPLVELLALATLEIRKRGARSLSFSPAPERSYLALRDYGLGDYVPVWASRNLREPLGIDYVTFDADAPGASGYQRMYAIPIALDDNGVERPGPLLTSQDTGNSF